MTAPHWTRGPARHTPREIETHYGRAQLEWMRDGRVRVFFEGAPIGVVVRMNERADERVNWTFHGSPYGYRLLPEAVLGMVRRHKHRVHQARYRRRRPGRVPHPWPPGLFANRLHLE